MCSYFCSVSLLFASVMCNDGELMNSLLRGKETDDSMYSVTSELHSGCQPYCFFYLTKSGVL